MTQFSVVIPLYNKKNHIARAIDSVLNQSVGDYELIIVNDGSTDGGEGVVEQYSDERIKLINKANGGESSARNAGIRAASSACVAFLDADDAWESDFLEAIQSLMREYPECGGYATRIRDTCRSEPLTQSDVPQETWNTYRIQDYFQCLSDGNYLITSSSICVKKEVLEQAGYFDEGLMIGPDVDMWIKVFLRAGWCITDKVCALYFTNAENRSTVRPDFSQREIEFLNAVRRRYVNKIRNLPSKQKFKSWLSERIYHVIVRLFMRGDRWEASKIYFNHVFALNYQHKLLGLLYLLTPDLLMKTTKAFLRK